MGVACRELVHQPLLLPFAFSVVGTVSLAWVFWACASRLTVFSVARMYSEASYLLCPRFTVPEYYCSRARLRLRLAYSKWHRSSPPLSQQRGGLHPSADTVLLWPPTALIVQAGTKADSNIVQPRQTVLVYLVHRPVHMACSDRLRHGAASSKAGWPKHSAVQRATAVSAQPWPLLAHPHPHPPSLPHPA